LKSQRGSGTCSDRGLPLKSIFTLASEQTSSLRWVSQYMVPQREQHCSGEGGTGLEFVLVRVLIGFVSARAGYLQQHFALEHALDLFHEQLWALQLDIRPEKDSCSPCCASCRARRRRLQVPAIGIVQQELKNQRGYGTWTVKRAASFLSMMLLRQLRSTGSLTTSLMCCFTYLNDTMLTTVL
jgi:hypothetical protein